MTFIWPSLQLSLAYPFIFSSVACRHHFLTLIYKGSVGNKEERGTESGNGFRVRLAQARFKQPLITMPLTTVIDLITLITTQTVRLHVFVHAPVVISARNLPCHYHLSDQKSLSCTIKMNHKWNPRKIQWNNMGSEKITYLFMHFNVQPIGHLIILQEKKKREKCI